MSTKFLFVSYSGLLLIGKNSMYSVYILLCADKTLYIGSTNNLEKRIHSHNNLKSGAHYTKIRRPVILKYSELNMTYAEARKREAELKRLTREEKLSLIKTIKTSRHTHIQAKDLTKVAPRSPKERIGGFAILARAIDKGRATLAGTNGEYNFDCPLDNKLFSFKGVKGEAFKAYLAEGHTDEEMVAWLKENGSPKTDAEIKAWSDAFKTDYSYANDPAKKDWFHPECERLGLDPMKTTLFDYLDVDDKSLSEKGETCPV